MAAQFPTYSFNFQLPLTPDGTDRDLQTQLLPIHLAIHSIAGVLDQYTGRLQEPSDFYPDLGTTNINTIGLNRFYCQAGEGIAVGDLIYFDASGTTVVAKKAKGNAIGTAAKGIYIGLNALLLGDWAEFILSPTLLTGQIGLTPGATYYLSPATSGLYTATRTAVATQVIQDIGWAISDTILFVTPDKSAIVV